MTDVKVQGERRICTFANGTVQHEKIINYSGGSRSYSYEIESGPLPVRNSQGKFAVKAKDGSAEIDWAHEFEALDPAQEQQVAAMWEKAMDQTAESLRKLVDAT